MNSLFTTGEVHKVKWVVVDTHTAENACDVQTTILVRVSIPCSEVIALLCVNVDVKSVIVCIGRASHKFRKGAFIGTYTGVYMYLNIYVVLIFDEI